MGAKLYGNTFASQAHLLDYAPDFKKRLAETKQIKSGPGPLVFCGNGVRWHPSNLEDFADVYHAGKHRQDDPFAEMEEHHIKEREIKFSVTWTILVA